MAESTSASQSTVWANALTFGNDWVYDDVRLPQRWWDNIESAGTHHLWVGEQGYYPYALLSRRLLSIPWYAVLDCIPMCGVKRCVNPMHLVLVLETEAT